MKKTQIIYAKISVFILFLVLLDQFSKHLATVCLKGKQDFNIIRNVLSFHYLDGGNTGAAWGMLSGKRVLFVIFTVIALIVIGGIIRNLVSIQRNSFTDKWKFTFLTYSFGLLTAGALGNLIDRVLHGYVIDFIWFQPINFPIFNVADCYVTISCCLILILCFFKLKDEEFNRIFSFRQKKGNS